MASRLILEGRKDEAFDCARQAWALSLTAEQNNLALGSILRDFDRAEEFLPYYERACTVRPVQRNRSSCANALVVAGHEEKAREAAQYASSLVESDWGAYELACEL